MLKDRFRRNKGILEWYDALAVAVAERLGAEGTERLRSLHQMKKDYFPDG